MGKKRAVTCFFSSCRKCSIPYRLCRICVSFHHTLLCHKGVKETNSGALCIYSIQPFVIWKDLHYCSWLHGYPHFKEGPRGRRPRCYHRDPPSRGKWGKQPQAISHHLTVWVFCLLSLCWEISWSPVMLSLIDRHTRKVNDLAYCWNTPCSGIQWKSAPMMLCCPTWLAPCILRHNILNNPIGFCSHAEAVWGPGMGSYADIHGYYKLILMYIVQWQV